MDPDSLDNDLLSIHYANTYCSVRGSLYDGIGTPAQLLEWLRAHATALGVDAHALPSSDLMDGRAAAFVELRDAIRSAIRAIVEHKSIDLDDIRVINHAASVAPRWPTLSIDTSGLSVVERTDADALSTTSAVIAQHAIRLLGTETHREDLRACRREECIQYFVKDHPRRKWCSTACANRDRASRHYQRHRQGREQ